MPRPCTFTLTVVVSVEKVRVRTVVNEFVTYVSDNVDGQTVNARLRSRAFLCFLLLLF